METDNDSLNKKKVTIITIYMCVRTATATNVHVDLLCIHTYNVLLQLYLTPTLQYSENTDQYTAGDLHEWLYIST